MTGTIANKYRYGRKKAKGFCFADRTDGDTYALVGVRQLSSLSSSHIRMYTQTASKRDGSKSEICVFCTTQAQTDMSVSKMLQNWTVPTQLGIHVSKISSEFIQAENANVDSQPSFNCEYSEWADIFCECDRTPKVGAAMFSHLGFLHSLLLSHRWILCKPCNLFFGMATFRIRIQERKRENTFSPYKLGLSWLS